MANAKNFCQLLSIFTCSFVLVICENKKLEDMKRLILLLCLSVVIGAVHAQTGRLDSSACSMWIILIRSRQQQARTWKSDSPPRCPIRMTLRWASGWRGAWNLFSLESYAGRIEPYRKHADPIRVSPRLHSWHTRKKKPGTSVGSYVWTFYRVISF